MKKTLFFFGLLVFAATGFADNLVLVNQTTYPAKNSKMAIQWVNSGTQVDEENSAVISGTQLNPDTLQVLTQAGKVNLTIPEKAEFFRVVVWSKGQGDPDLLTNWVEIVPKKTYTLEADHLVPSVLMIGTGC